MIPGARVEAFVASADLGRSRDFYVGTLGLTPLDDTPHMLVLEGPGAQLWVTAVGAVATAPYTVLGWSVPDLDAAIDDLVARGVAFHRYDGMEQDARGAWTAPSGTRVAWFADPDGNVLSLAQHPA